MSLQFAILYEMLNDLCEQVNKEGPKVKPDHIIRLPVHDYIRLFYIANPALLSTSDLEKRGPSSNLTTSEDPQSMICYRLVSYSRTLGPIISRL